jgi:hypothetical protein
MWLRKMDDLGNYYLGDVTSRSIFPIGIFVQGA